MRMFDVQGIEILVRAVTRPSQFEVEGLSSDGPADSERALLIEEVKIGCTLGMLQCLDRPHRLAYLLGEILDLSGPESAEALGISAELFRNLGHRLRTPVGPVTQLGDICRKGADMKVLGAGTLI